MVTMALRRSLSPESSVSVSSWPTYCSAASSSLLDIAHQGVALRDIALFLGHVKIRVDVARDARELLIGGDASFRAFTPLQNLLGLFLILPEVGLGGFSF